MSVDPGGRSARGTQYSGNGTLPARCQENTGEPFFVCSFLFQAGGLHAASLSRAKSWRMLLKATAHHDGGLAGHRSPH